MSPELALVMAIGKLILEHGIPAALNILRLWNVDNPSTEDIEALQGMVPPTSTYFGTRKDGPIPDKTAITALKPGDRYSTGDIDFLPGRKGPQEDYNS